MKNERGVLMVMFGLSILGVLFSGTLSYLELFGSVGSCPAVGAQGTIFGYPACVYGFGMFVILTVVSAYGLWGTKRG